MLRNASSVDYITTTLWLYHRELGTPAVRKAYILQIPSSSGFKMKIPLKIVVVAVAIILIILIGVAIRPLIFRSEETGPVYIEAISEDGLLKLTMVLEKTKFTVSPREPVRINLTLTNIGEEEMTMTFHYKTKFDFMIWDYSQGAYAYRWSYDHLQGPIGWAANASEYPFPITLEPPGIDTIVLKPGEKISQTLTWNHYYMGGLELPPVELALKGRYRVEGLVGSSRWDDPWSPDNPLRFFEYVTSDGTLVSTVLKTPGIDITLA